MKYILLAYANAEAWAKAMADWNPDAPMPAEMQAACDFYEEMGKELTETGEFVSTEGLAEPEHTRTLRKAGGDVIVTDGPYAEVKEVLVSYAIVDCATHERALEIAERVVAAVGDTVEVRPIPDAPGPLPV